MVHAAVAGALMVVRAPGLVAGLALLTIAFSLPFAAVVGSRVQAAIASQHFTIGEQPVDAEWWLHFLRHARGLEATFVPGIAGVSGPLTNVSRVLDGEGLHASLLPLLAAYALLWMFLWGGILERYLAAHRLGLRAFVIGCRTHFGTFVVVGVIALAAYALLYATVHPLLFEGLFPALRARAADERTAFLWRLVLYVVFGAALLSITVVADYTRVFAVRHRTPLPDAFARARRFVREHFWSVLAASCALAAGFVLLLAGYVTVEYVGGSRLGGWRALVVGQLYLALRLTLRLAFAATAVALVKALEGESLSRPSTS